MKVLVTAGNTVAPIDRVRCITNIFSGRTGAAIAVEAHRRGHAVMLLTSHPETVADLNAGNIPAGDRWAVRSYHTFDDLQKVMEGAIPGGKLEVIIHSAAVSDYRSAGVYAPASGTRFLAEDGHWESTGPVPLLVDRAAGKVKSDDPELWLRLVRTPKLVDRVRTGWGFRGILVKFKLEVDIGEEQLLEVAEQSRRQSAADLMVANTLDGMASWAYLGPIDGQYRRVGRRELAAGLLDSIESLAKERRRG
jgi:phosphopantothenoylcysteine synthetase/decarboxylase